MPTEIGGVHLDTSVLDRITAELKPSASRTVKQYGWLIAGDAAKMAPWDTGALHASILSESKMLDNDGMTFIVQDGVEYGIFQELGTSKMAAHPYLIPSMEKWAQKFIDAIGKLIGVQSSASAPGGWENDE